MISSLIQLQVTYGWTKTTDNKLETVAPLDRDLASLKKRPQAG